MAASDTARLVAELTLKDKFTGPSNKVLGSLGRLESGFDKIGAKATAGAKNFARNVGLIGVAAAAGIAVAVKQGLNDLATLESAITSVDGAIEQMGLTGQVTGKEVAKWANDIEADIGAAFDDKDITQAATTLIRFGKVTTKNLKPALTVIADLATKTGDVESAASLLAKALADPAKAAGKLARTGVILTKAQQDQIKAMLKVNDVAGAQAVVLDAVSKATKGAAAASQGPYQRALSVLNDVAEDARKALAEGFLPVIEKVATRLSKAVGDPRFIQSLRDFGNDFAGALDSLIDIAVKLPWQTIGDSLKLAGAGAKAVLNAFTSLPPWIQTAVLTGWGLNKLTGGALTGIAGEIGKGLLGGALGTRGATPANPIFVSPVGGGLGGPGGGGGVGGGLSGAAIGTGLTGVAIIGAVQAGAAAATQQIAGATAAEVQKTVGGGPLNVFGPFQRLIDALGGDLRSPLEKVEQNTKALGPKLGDLRRDGSQQAVRASERAEAIRNAVVQAGFHAQQASTGERAALGIIGRAQQSAVSAIKDTRSETARVAQAVRDKKLSVKVNNNVTIQNKVWVGETIKAQTTFKKLGGFVAS